MDFNTGIIHFKGHRDQSHLIAEEHYEKYMDQEEDYWREHDYSYGSVN